MSMESSLYRKSLRNYNILRDFLKKISYKPGWKVSIQDEHDDFTFTVIVNYEDYESKNAAFDPLAQEDSQVSQARQVLARSLGRNVRKRETRYFQKRFDFMTLDHMAPEDVIRFVIANTIKQAEIFEFERWFKVEGFPVFEHKENK